MPHSRNFIELPGGRIKISRNKRGGPRAEKGWYKDDWDGKHPIPEKTHVQQVGATEELDLLGFEHIPPTKIVAACYNGNGHIVLRDESGRKFRAPIRHAA